MCRARLSLNHRLFRPFFMNPRPTETRQVRARFSRPARAQSGRKRMGVEPTRKRIAPPTGFEARPSHQGRFSSSSCVLFIYRLFAGHAAFGCRRDIERKQTVGTHEMLVMHAPRETDAIEEFEDLDRALAS